MNSRTESGSASACTAIAEERSLEELLKRRVLVERHFASLGHTYRHGRFHREFEHRVFRPVLKLGLRMTGLYARGIRSALSPVIRNIRLRFANLPASLEGFQILHLSDLHIDGSPGLADALIPLLRDLRPDVCVMTGDYRFEDEGPSEAVYPLMRDIVSNIEARFGTFGILGNHDTSEMALRLEEMGIRMLVNEAVPIGNEPAPLWLAGVDDPFDYRCDDLERAVAAVPADAFTVLLAHSPEMYDAAAEAGVSLYLSGHTHAGQIRVPGIGALRQNARCPRAYNYGHWRHGMTQGYTSAGVGCSSLPVRLWCPPEIALIELRS